MSSNYFRIASLPAVFKLGIHILVQRVADLLLRQISLRYLSVFDKHQNRNIVGVDPQTGKSCTANDVSGAGHEYRAFVTETVNIHTVYSPCI